MTLNDCKYMASWRSEDTRTSSISEILAMDDKPVWIFWDGSLPEGEPPPCRVTMISTGITYTWEDFQKVRS